MTPQQLLKPSYFLKISSQPIGAKSKIEAKTEAKNRKLIK